MSNEFMSNEKFFFENLDIYKRSLKFSVELCKIASKFHIQFSRLRDQLIGAAISIPLNIAEGSGRKTSKDKSNFYRISRTSVFECVPILEICFQLNLIEESVHTKFKQEAIELSRMLSGLIKTL